MLFGDFNVSGWILRVLREVCFVFSLTLAFPRWFGEIICSLTLALFCFFGGLLCPDFGSALCVGIDLQIWPKSGKFKPYTVAFE